MERIGNDTLHFSYVVGYIPSALPLGELSPKVTERVLHPNFPSPSSLRSATSPKGRGKRRIKRELFTHIYQLTRERSKKTEAVFLVGSRESEGKSKSPQALFLLPAFSFGEAKENADGQLQICTVYQPFERLLETPEASPMRGSCRRRRLMRWTAPRRRKYLHLIRHGFRRATFPS